MTDSRQSSPGLRPLCWVPNPFVPQDTQCLHCGRLEGVNCPDAHKIDASKLFVECLSQCGAKFCGISCREAAAVKHNRLCVGPVTSEHPLYRLKMLALEAGESRYAMIMLAAEIVLADDGNIIRPIDANPSQNTSDEEVDIARTTHELMVEIMEQGMSTSFQDWSSLLHHVNRNCLSVSVRSNYAIACGRIEEDSLHPEQYDYLLNRTETSSLIELIDEADHHFPSVESFCLLKETPMISCVPSHGIACDNMLELRYRPIVAGDGGSQFKPLTCSRIDNDADLEERTFALEEKGIECHCVRCRFERHPEESECTMEELESIMDLATLQTRYDDASDIVNGMLKLTPRDGAALLLQSRIAGWQGGFHRREMLLKEAAVAADTNCEPIRVALKEANAYYRREACVELHPSGLNDRWIAAEDLDDSVFVGENILDADECGRMVHVAETFHARSGKCNWTTSRHYAVPTTDIPIYQISELLSWFNIQLERKIFPAMMVNFEIDENSRLRIFDAFLVKYDAATGQKRLPLHNDQSEYSLTIAMNPMDEYEGGGTYFCDTNESIKTEVGGVISFEGDLLHAGTMITKGTRYIIVCFIYEEQMC